MTLVVAAIAAIAALYQLIAIAASVSHKLRRPVPIPSDLPPVSVLKPVYGLDDGFYEAIRSQAEQDHPQFELLFGVADTADPAVTAIDRLMRDFPSVPIRLIICRTEAPNRKVGVLMDLAAEARYPLVVVNDSDISVERDYLSNVVAPLADPSIGLVTCVYRAEARDWPSRWEALAVATDFAPSTLVAPFFGVSEFGLGSTLAFRRSDLDRIGGFLSVADYLADDYQVGCKLHALGLRNIISQVVVSTRLAGGSWPRAWKHQLRWARTIRLSRAGGYYGLPVTFATLWAVIEALFGMWWTAIALLLIRIAMAIAAGWFVLGSRDVLRYFYLIPLRDLSGVVVWIAGLFGDTVEWRDRHLKLDRSGRIS